MVISSLRVFLKDSQIALSISRGKAPTDHCLLNHFMSHVLNLKSFKNISFKIKNMKMGNSCCSSRYLRFGWVQFARVSFLFLVKRVSSQFFHQREYFEYWLFRKKHKIALFINQSFRKLRDRHTPRSRYKDTHLWIFMGNIHQNRLHSYGDKVGCPSFLANRTNFVKHQDWDKSEAGEVLTYSAKFKRVPKNSRIKIIL